MNGERNQSATDPVSLLCDRLQHAMDALDEPGKADEPWPLLPVYWDRLDSLLSGLLDDNGDPRTEDPAALLVARVVLGEDMTPMTDSACTCPPGPIGEGDYCGTQRVPEASCATAARELWALLHNGRRPEGYWDAESECYYRSVVERFLASPAVARALVGMEGMTSHTELMVAPDRPDPNTTGAILDLAGYPETSEAIRSLVHRTFKEISGAIWTRSVLRDPWRVVDTEGGDQS